MEKIERGHDVVYQLRTRVLAGDLTDLGSGQLSGSLLGWLEPVLRSCVSLLSLKRVQAVGVDCCLMKLTPG